MRYFTFDFKMCKFCQLISQRVFNQKEFYCNILISSQDQLQEYAIKNRSLKLNLKTQGDLDVTISRLFKVKG